MKIGIITFNSAHNYGAVLQCWALQEYLRSEGHNVTIINYRLPAIDNVYKLYKPKNIFKKRKKLNKVVHVLQFVKKIANEPNKVKRYRAFEKFINKTLNTTKPYTKYSELKSANFDFDTMIVGSDQVWNGSITKGVNPAYFLAFGNENIKRISYAASIGHEAVPEIERTLFQRYLRDFDYVSVREESARESVKQLTDKEVALVLDPTLLLEKEKFDKIKKDPKVKQDYIYVHNVHLGKVDKRLNAVAEEMSTRLGIPIIHNRADYDYTNELQKFVAGGPDEFIGYIANAKYVITNSFHATVFAIIYRRDFITIPHITNPERMRFLLENLEISNHLIGDVKNIPNDLKELSIDYDNVDKIRELQKANSISFLQTSLSGEKTASLPVTEDKKYFDTKDIYSCYGCGACKDICPVNAITMEVDKEGFWYPEINEEKCIHCNMCRKECIYGKYKDKKVEAKETFPKIYAAYNNSDEVRANSASGGMFTPMYQNILARGGKVVGVKYTDDMEVIYDIAETEEECESFRGSKYVAADSRDVKPRVKELLDKGSTVLFTGNPCQIAGLKSYLRKDYDNLYTVEIICHGVGSPKVFKLYVEYLERIYKSKMVDFQFRNKIRGWSTPYVCIKFESGEVLLEQASKNKYNRGYSSRNIERPSCYTCEFADNKNGVGDITIGDYWGIDKQHPEMLDQKGVSVIKINNERGQKFFEQLKGQFTVVESDYAKAYAANHKKPLVLLAQRNKLMSQIDDVEIEKLLDFSKK